MGGGAQELTGPDLEKGIPFADLIENKPVLGHAHGEAVVVVRVADDVHAVGASCTHYGGPIAEGRVVGTTIRCPWHHACFDLKSGRASAPALTDLACFDVARDGDLVQVRSKKAAKAPPKPKHSPSSIVIVGAGAAGAACVETLRKEGYDGPITMLGNEEPGPVDRPNLSKDYLAGTAPEEWIALGSREHYVDELKIDLQPTDAAKAIDIEKKTVTTTSDKTIAYDALLFATGAEPTRLSIEGASLPNVFTLRSLADSRAIIEKAKNSKSAVIIGASFIGLEVAASLLARKIEVHIVAPEDAPLARILGAEVGSFLKKLHEEKGARFHLGTTPKKITAPDGTGLASLAVELASGESVACDLVVLGVGVKPRVALAKDAGIVVDEGVVVDESLRTSAPGVWAAGDVARYQINSANKVRIEHWAFAERTGEHAARAMLCDPSEPGLPFKDVPFFWSVHHDVTLAYVGHVSNPQSITVHGSLEKRDATIAYKAQDGKIRAVVTINRDAISLEVEEAMERNDYESIESIVSRA